MRAHRVNPMAASTQEINSHLIIRSFFQSFYGIFVFRLISKL